MSQAVGVFYNHTGDLPCFDPFGGTDPDSDADADFWDLQWCAEMTMPFSKDGGAGRKSMEWGTGSGAGVKLGGWDDDVKGRYR